jgi:undecaprenyl-diphosphatase
MDFYAIDVNLLKFINKHHSLLLDEWMWLFSSRLFWIPFYLLIAYILHQKFKNLFFYLLLGGVLTILLSDQISVLIKNTVMRLRPSHEPGLANQLHYLYNYVGGLYGFVSSHAANAGALAVYVFSFTRRAKWIRYLLIIYVFLVCYSRIYLGVHYPSDILAGLIVGFILGLLTSRLVWLAISKNFLHLKL